ncbi:NADP-dependent oxidoreductase [Allokutzneria sp. A3M-2-11 16]|uniref:MDR family NADP-dependent oxidoreductase n=1 Tax=Allokutzneria sp. A3M-2-11 16 TaxID=2962043 RepID=UPI0020B8D9F9|nr:NADP-dependent oxidoreductase [Allokutzneria sp. A3M-2-11 16]MCP3802891.1 NADP-dependent oxidoreductase [Allokutzneria sp. A3M-2-11 16]
MTTSREVRLAAVPEGLPTPEHLSVVEGPLPVPGPGEVLVRNRFFQVFPALRTLFGGGVEGTPFPPLHPGDTLFGGAIGEVVEGPLPRGALISHWLGWREFAVVPVEQCVVLDDTLPDPVAHLSQGLTAFAALTRAVEIKPGDTVFVSGGAGAVGSLAAQYAKRLGAGRVIGSTGSAWKADRMRSEFGYDAVVLRGDMQLDEGIDVFVDNVGGDQLTAAITAANDGARFVLVGALSSQLSPDHPGTTAFTEVDLLQLIAKRITMRGLSPLDYAGAQGEWAERFGAWLRSGEVTFPHTRIAGIENAPRALHELLSGQHVGAVIVEF